MMQSLDDLRHQYNATDSPIVHYLQRFQDSVGATSSVFFLVSPSSSHREIPAGLFAESEQAQVLREIRVAEPEFDLERWLREVHEYIIPEVLDGFTAGNLEVLRTWCTDGPYNLLKTIIDERMALGHTAQTKVMELRNVDVRSLPSFYPVSPANPTVGHGADH